MALNSGTKNFWIQFGYIVGTGLLLTAVAYFIWGGTGAVIAGVLAIFQVIWFLISVKSAILRSLPTTWEIELTHPDEFPGLDHDYFEQQTHILEELGFEILADYKLTNSVMAGFARCFSHPQQYCFCEINQCFPTNSDPISNCLIGSLMAQNWMLVHLNQPVSIAGSLSYLWRSPRTVVFFLPAGVQPHLPTLVHTHLEMRQQMVRNLGITVQTDVSWAAYQAHEHQMTTYRRDRLQQRNFLLGMLEVLLFELNPKSVWLGEYARWVK